MEVILPRCVASYSSSHISLFHLILMIISGFQLSVVLITSLFFILKFRRWISLWSKWVKTWPASLKSGV